MGLEGEGCHTVREEMFKCIQWNNNPGPMSCIWDFQHHERSPTLEMKGCHGLASKFKKSPLSHMTLKCISILPLPFNVCSGQVPSFFKHTLFLSHFEKSWALQLLVSCCLHFAVFSWFLQHSLYNNVTKICMLSLFWQQSKSFCIWAPARKRRAALLASPLRPEDSSY